MLNLSELSRHMIEKKIQNEPAKVEVWKMFENDVLNNILKPCSPYLQLFLMEVLTPYTEFENSFFADISHNMHFWAKSFK